MVTGLDILTKTFTTELMVFWKILASRKSRASVVEIGGIIGLSNRGRIIIWNVNRGGTRGRRRSKYRIINRGRNGINRCGRRINMGRRRINRGWGITVLLSRGSVAVLFVSAVPVL